MIEPIGVNIITRFCRTLRRPRELGGLVAHLYGLSEAEFVHIPSTFPLVLDAVKAAAQKAYRDVERGLI